MYIYIKNTYICINICILLTQCRFCYNCQLTVYEKPTSLPTNAVLSYLYLLLIRNIYDYAPASQVSKQANKKRRNYSRHNSKLCILCNLCKGFSKKLCYFCVCAFFAAHHLSLMSVCVCVLWVYSFHADYLD